MKRDRHVATSSPRAFQEAFILGGISLSKLEELGVTWRSGDVDPSNGTKFWTDCINVKMGDLLSNEEMLVVFRCGPWPDPKVLGSKGLHQLTRLLGKLDARGHLARWRR